MERLYSLNPSIALPPGFRFHPTDEELITRYLSPKVLDNSFNSTAVGEVDLNKVEPWELPWKAKIGEQEWYFFCVRDRKYQNGSRANRSTTTGYWKATGKDKEIFHEGNLVGTRKTLVFHRGRAPQGLKTDWVIHEYRLQGNTPSSFQNMITTDKIEWVLCRVFKKSGGKRVHISRLGTEEGTTSKVNVEEGSHVTCFSNPPPITSDASNHGLPSDNDLGFKIYDDQDIPIHCLWDY